MIISDFTVSLAEQHEQARKILTEQFGLYSGFFDSAVAGKPWLFSVPDDDFIPYGDWPDFLKQVADELRHDRKLFVYAACHDFFSFGDCYALLCVSPYSEDLEYCVYGSGPFRCYAYVYNASRPELSESGYVTVACEPFNLRYLG